MGTGRRAELDVRMMGQVEAVFPHEEAWAAVGRIGIHRHIAYADTPLSALDGLLDWFGMKAMELEGGG